MSMIIHVVKHALTITGFVGVMMLVIEYVNVLTQGAWQTHLAKSRWGQYVLAAFLGVAYTAMSLLQFSRSEEIFTHTNTPSLLVEARACFRAYPVLRRLVFAEILSGGITLLLPFLAIYGTEELGFALSWIGLFIIAQKAGSILGNLVWIPLGNRHGTRLVILLGLVSGLLGAVVVWTVHTPLGFTLAFALLGLAQSGTQVGFSGYILEIGHHEIRPLLIAIEQTLLIPLYFAPVLGGVLADQLGYASLAVAATLLLGVALYLAYRLCEPRNGPSSSPTSWKSVMPGSFSATPKTTKRPWSSSANTPHQAPTPEFVHASSKWLRRPASVQIKKLRRAAAATSTASHPNTFDFASTP